ncbi:acyltransferase family protein [Actinoplanes palleronii]|uniref:Acyltransferase n=1 Tax=Actinoplanes palleronii TaxID=113570 RepID=A0ABQ4B220_9ACTN|nr:acyltransferase [Actinoplanes palleronii]GIE64709.1 acyltransferase [Actinoplanes palleronii]
MAFLDGLRLVAALMVVLYHYAGLPRVASVWDVPSIVHAFPDLSRIASYGWLGVELFFLISGFVICMSSWGRDAGAFARSRIVRLFPAYWAAVLITVAVTAIWSEPRPLTANWSEILTNLTMLPKPLGVPQVEGVYWTLWVEARFYLLFAFLVWWGLTTRRVLVFGYGWLIVATYAVEAESPLLSTIVMPDYAAFFAGGIGFFLIHKFGSDLKFWGLVGFSWLIAQHNTYDMVLLVNRPMPRPMSATAGVLLVTVFYVLMAGVALGWFRRVTWGWLTTAGLLTYPFYLLHEKIGWVLIHQMRDLRPRYLTLMITVAVMLVAAWLLHRLVERPLAGYLRTRLATPTPDTPRGTAPRARVPQEETPRDDTPPERAPDDLIRDASRRTKSDEADPGSHAARDPGPVLLP